MRKYVEHKQIWNYPESRIWVLDRFGVSDKSQLEHGRTPSWDLVHIFEIISFDSYVIFLKVMTMFAGNQAGQLNVSSHD